MRISLLLKREPFHEIFSKTFTGFLQQQTGKKCAMEWGRVKKDNHSQTWFCNNYLNAIYPENINLDSFSPLRLEFSRSLIGWRRPIQKAYVRLATSRIGSQWLAHSRLRLTPPVAESAHWMIVPGNHKIRILDYKSQHTISILKNGFDRRYLSNEVTSRQQAERYCLPVPPLLNNSMDQNWFVETFVLGTPLNRLADRSEEKRILTLSLSAMQPFYQANVVQYNVNHYCDPICTRLFDLIEKNHLLSTPLRQALVNCIHHIQSLLVLNAKSIPSPILTTLAHGDFQPANILWDQKRFWLIDWEYSGQRQFSYDLLTYLLSSRFSKGLAGRLFDFVRNCSTSLFSTEELISREPAWVNPAVRFQSALIFCLEETLLHLEENSNPLFFQLGGGLPSLLTEVTNWLEMGNTHI